MVTHFVSRSAVAAASLFCVLFIHTAQAQTSYRIENVWTGRYLNALENADWADINAAPLNAEWGSMVWEEEVVTGNIIRLRNSWTGRYLNCNSDQDWVPVQLAPLAPEWGSQQWAKVDAGDGNVRLQCQWGQRFLNVLSEDDFAEIQNAPGFAEWGSQQWTFVPVEPAKPTPPPLSNLAFTDNPDVILYLPLDGNVNDASLAEQTAVFNNSYGSFFSEGVKGDAAYFSGAEDGFYEIRDHIKVNNSPSIADLIAGNQMTFSGWFYHNKYREDKNDWFDKREESFFSLYAPGLEGQRGDYIFLARGETHLQGTSRLTSKGEDFFRTRDTENWEIVPYGEWYHLIWAVNGDRHTIYINGSNTLPDGRPLTTNTTPFASLNELQSVSDLFIGTRGGSWVNFDGRIDDYAVFNRELSAEEAKRIYDSY